MDVKPSTTLATRAEANRNKNVIADGTSMTLRQMREYLQDYYGIPIALKEEGANAITCPYCGELHYTARSGHQEAACTRDTGRIIIGDRYCIQNYGYTVVTYNSAEQRNQVIVPDNLLR